MFIHPLNKDQQDFGDERLTHTIILCDLDGVLFDCEHRLKYLEQKDYANFYGCEMANDSRHYDNCVSAFAVIAGVKAIYGEHCTLLFCTGRPRRTMKLTDMMLERYFKHLYVLCGDNELTADSDPIMLCREDKDWRPSGEVKIDTFIKWIKRSYFKESGEGIDNDELMVTRVFVIDDNQHILNAFDKTFEDKLKTAMSLDEDNGQCPPALSLIKLGNSFSNSEPNKPSEE